MDERAKTQSHPCQELPVLHPLGPSNHRLAVSGQKFILISCCKFVQSQSMSIRDFNAREWEGDADDRIQRHFKYQPDCTLDSEGEKLENEAHLTAHPGTRYLHTGLDFLQYEVKHYAFQVPSRILEPHERGPSHREPWVAHDRLDLFRLARQLKTFELAEKLRKRQRAREDSKAAKNHINQYRPDVLVAVDSKLPHIWTVLAEKLGSSVSQDPESGREETGSLFQTSPLLWQSSWSTCL